MMKNLVFSVLTAFALLTTVAARADPDTDGDGVQDSVDNCTLIANPPQRDTNGDGFGNRCDPDLNNDGVVNFLDAASWASLFLTTDPDADFDGSGAVNFVDYAVLAEFFLQPPGPSGVAP